MSWPPYSAGARMHTRDEPPMRKSISALGEVNPVGPHHRITWAGSFQAFQTSSTGASRTRVMTTSNVLAPPFVPFSGMVIYPFLLVVGADLLDRPAVAIRVVEVDEPDVVEGLAFAGRAPGPPCGSCQGDGAYSVLSRPSWSKAVGEVHDRTTFIQPSPL